MDLNEPPPNFDFDFLDATNATTDAYNLVYCTQLRPHSQNVPTVSEEVWSTPQVPYTGQTFATQYEARAYYNDYAKRIRFSIRTNTSRRSGYTDEVEKIHAEHEEDNQDGLKKKKKADGGKKRKREKMKYTKCKARMVVKLIGSRWQVIYFVPDQNHDLILKPSLKKFLRSHKGIPSQEREFITLLHGCNLTTGRIMQLMSEFYGSAQLVPYEAKNIKLDDENRVEHIFWVDSAARHAYIEAYHDCIFFDATYMTNMYDIPFPLFIGINRHGNTFNYKWLLFETFLKAMKGIAPLNITTDQDVAMRNAISIVFPYATHRNCRWYIMDKFAGIIGLDLDANKELEEDFKERMNYSSTQRSEGFNAFLKKYVNLNLSILRFFRQYQKIQEKWLVAQDGQDFRTDENERSRWSKYPIEKHAATVYTKNLFYRFSKEFEKTAEYDSLCLWLWKKNYLVTAVEKEESYYCECSKFDRDGIICCHIMKIMTRLGVKAIPDRFVLKRWTQETIPNGENDVMNVPADLVARDMPISNQKTLRFTNISTAFAELAIEGAHLDETCAVGVKKEKRLMKGMNAKAKRKNHCSVCKSTSHNAARCPNKLQKGAERQELKLFA
ncbi:hypothetical protein BS78_07G056800 [Paspalum vaginatum]|nr:hypothetical protein BS78_07G056800 [Paspalum vaginatum]